MAKRNQKSGGDWGWPLIVLLFCIGAWPIALLLLFGKLFGADEKKPAQEAPPLHWDEEARRQYDAGRAYWKEKRETRAQEARRQGRAAQAVKNVTRSPADKKSTALWLKLLGLILLFVGVNGVVDAADSLLWVMQSGTASLWWLEDMLGACAFTAAGGGMLYKGFSMDRQMKRFSKYLLVMGDREAVAIDELARTLGYSQRRVERDLEKMIDRGYFGGKAYLNQELGYLFRSGGAGEAFRRKEEEAAPPPKEAEEGYSGILRNIRRANDRIADPVLSAKIDRLEEITARIFRAVEEDPQKAGKIDTFMNYYLPTTQKLLDSYAEFEAAGVEGENLRQAKQRIENTMDSIVKGFEHQLDELYKAEAMDVDSDIRVMEHMLRRDTGTVEQDFGLGGSAAQRSPEDP